MIVPSQFAAQQPRTTCCPTTPQTYWRRSRFQEVDSQKRAAGGRASPTGSGEI